MADLGTLVIAFFGYGFTLLIGLGSLIAMVDSLAARRRRQKAKCNEERETFIFGTILTIILAAVTRWRVGGA